MPITVYCVSFVCCIPLQVCVEVLLEYPFFVFGQGWSSCCPDRTTQLLELSCAKLCVGDVCVSLTLRSLRGGGGSVSGRNHSSQGHEVKLRHSHNTGDITQGSNRQGNSQGNSQSNGQSIDQINSPINSQSNGQRDGQRDGQRNGQREQSERQPERIGRETVRENTGSFNSVCVCVCVSMVMWLCVQETVQSQNPTGN